MVRLGRKSLRMETTPLCALPHAADGRIPRLSVSELVRRDRMSHMWAGRLDKSRSDLLDGVLAEARSRGVCPLHLRLMRSELAELIASGRPTIA